MKCKVIHAGQMTDSFMVKTGVRHGCLLSPFLFLLAIDWIMTRTTENRKNGTQWTPWSQLEDLDFADDLAFLSHCHQQIQENRPSKHSVNTDRIQHQQKQDKNHESQHEEQQPSHIWREPLEETDSFKYLGSIINKSGGTEEDIKARTQKARVAFLILKTPN